MTFPTGYLAEHPLPTGIIGALGLAGYQLLADVAGVGAGRLGPQAFLLVAPDPDPSLPDAGTQIALHHSGCAPTRGGAVRAAGRAARLSAALGLPARARAPRPALARSTGQPGDRGRSWPRSPTSTPVGCLPRRWRGRRPAARLRALPPAGPAARPDQPRADARVLLALALRDDDSVGAEAVELADRALPLTRGDAALDPPAALVAAKQQASGLITSDRQAAPAAGLRRIPAGHGG